MADETGPEQALKEIVEEEVKKEKVGEGTVEIEDSWFKRKKFLIFIAAGLFFLLIFVYYLIEYVRS